MTTLTGTLGTQTLTGPGTWNAAGATTLNGMLTLANGAALENDGTMTLGVQGTATSYGDITGSSGSVFTNAASATINAVGGGAYFEAGASVNAGTINLAVPHNPKYSYDYDFSGSLINSGTIALQSGTLQFNGAVTSTGSITAAAGTTIDFSAKTATIGGVFNAAGAVSLGGPGVKVVFASNATIGGTLTNPGGFVEIGATATLTAGNLTGPAGIGLPGGSYILDQGATLNCLGTATSYDLNPTYVTFLGSGGELKLSAAQVLAWGATPNPVYGTYTPNAFDIAGFTQGDVIDLAGTVVASTQENTVKLIAGGVLYDPLTLSAANGAAITTLYFAEPTATTGWTLTPDGLGGTLVSIGTAPSWAIHTGPTPAQSTVLAFENPTHTTYGLPTYAVGVNASGDSLIGFQNATMTPGHGAGSTAGAGIDNTVLLAGPRSQYAIQVDGSGTLKIKDLSTTDATAGQTVTITGATDVVFNNGSTGQPATVNGAANPNGDIYDQVAYILPEGVLGTAGDATVARMYQVATGANPSLSQLDAWLKFLDSGAKTITTIAQNFAYNAQSWFGIEFPSQDTGPAPAGGYAPISDADFVGDLYTNMLGHKATAAGIAVYTGILSSIAATQSQAVARGVVLYDFATSTEAMLASQSWLVGTSTGGTADPGLPFTATQVLNDAVTNDYLNLNLLTPAAVIGASSAGASGAGGYALAQNPANGAWMVTAGTTQNGGGNGAGHVNNQGVVILSPQVTEAVINGNDAHVYNGSNTPTPAATAGQSPLSIVGITLNGAGDWLDLNPTIATKVVVGGSDALINGFAANFDQIITPPS